MPELKCKICDYRTGPKADDTKARQALAMHISRKHGKMKGSPNAMTKKKAKRKIQRRGRAIPEPTTGCPNCRLLADIAHNLLETLVTKP